MIYECLVKYNVYPFIRNYMKCDLYPWNGMQVSFASLFSLSAAARAKTSKNTCSWSANWNQGNKFNSKKLQTYLSSDKRVDRWFLLRDFCWDLETNLRSLNPYSRWIFLSSIFKLSTLVSTIQLELSLSPLSSHEKLTETETPEKLTRFTFSVSAKHFSWNYHVSTSILIISILQAQENGRCPSRNLKTSRLLTRYP